MYVFFWTLLLLVGLSWASDPKSPAVEQPQSSKDDLKTPEDAEKAPVAKDESLNPEENLFNDRSVIYFNEEPPIYNQIFDHKITLEMKSKFKETFGKTEAQFVLFHPQRYTKYFSQDGQFRTSWEVSELEKEFGIYMFRRLTEYHADNYLRGNEELKPVYEFKKKVSEVKVEIDESMGLDFNYSFPGNFIEMKFRNPYCDSKVIVEMDKKAIGPTQAVEYKSFLGYELDNNLHFETWLFLLNKIYSVGFTKHIDENISTSFHYWNNDVVQEGEYGGDRENKVLTTIGITY